MSNLIDKVYIPNTYKHGEYILKDIPFNVTYQSDNDILIENTGYNFLKNPYPRINIHDEHRFYGINSDIQDISKILKVTYDPEDRFSSRYIVNESSAWRSALQWVHDYKKGIDEGFAAIRKQAAQAIEQLDDMNPADTIDKKAFYEAVQITCDAIILWAHRHSEKAKALAETEQNPKRKE